METTAVSSTFWWFHVNLVNGTVFSLFIIYNCHYKCYLLTPLNKPSCTRNKHIINLSKQQWQCEKAYVVCIAKPAYFGKFTRISPGNDSQRKIIEAFRLSKSKPSFEKCNHPCKVEKKQQTYTTVWAEKHINARYIARREYTHKCLCERILSHNRINE